MAPAVLSRLCNLDWAPQVPQDLKAIPDPLDLKAIPDHKATLVLKPQQDPQDPAEGQ